MVKRLNEIRNLYDPISREWAVHIHRGLLSITLLVVLSLSSLRAQDTVTNEATRQEFIDKFKADTGFNGRVYLYPDLLKIKDLSGIFNDIVVDENTERMEMASKLEQVRGRVMPYLHANDVQLEWSRLYLTYDSQTLEYSQVTNDYPLHKDLPIYYNYLVCFEYRTTPYSRLYPSSFFHVMDLTVPVPTDSVFVAYSAQEVNQIIKDHYSPHDDKLEIVQGAELRYADIPVEGKTQQMNLYYVAYTNSLIVFVNPTTGKIVHDRSKFPLKD